MIVGYVDNFADDNTGSRNDSEFKIFCLANTLLQQNSEIFAV